MPVFKSQRRPTNEESLRDRRWSSIVWNALVPAAHADHQASLFLCSAAWLLHLPMSSISYVKVLHHLLSTGTPQHRD